ncbi:MAG: hypothetical protein HYY04_14825 [Chloroflexi bacterium]|nr:hypothetical protein [Chloroflexota bacterium]
MHSSMIGKIEKARRYAQEPDRLSLTGFKATFQGEHDRYAVEYDDGTWRCNCHFFPTWGVCSHTMAIERILGGRLAKPPAEAAPARTAS